MIDKDGKSKERYLFLFKARILVCKVRRISEDRSVFVLKDIIRVSDFFLFHTYNHQLKNFSFLRSKIRILLYHPDKRFLRHPKKNTIPYFTEETVLFSGINIAFQLPEVEVKDHPGDIRSFELHNPTSPAYPITLVAHKDPVKAYWLREIRQYASDVVALAEHAADDLQLTEVPETKEEKVGNPGPKKAEGNPGPEKARGNPGPEEKTVEKRKDNPGHNPDSKQAKVEEEGADMSRRYSASRFSSSSKVVEGRVDFF